MDNIRKYVKDSVEEVQRTHYITVTFAFTDKDLEDEETRKLFNSLNACETTPQEDEDVYHNEEEATTFE